MSYPQWTARRSTVRPGASSRRHSGFSTLDRHSSVKCLLMNLQAFRAMAMPIWPVPSWIMIAEGAPLHKRGPLKLTLDQSCVEQEVVS